MKKSYLIVVVLLLSVMLFGKEYELKSPDNKIISNINLNQQIDLEVSYANTHLFSANNISLDLKGAITLGRNPIVNKKYYSTTKDIIKPLIKEKYASIDDNYNELKLDFKNNFSLIIRAYNTGIAYRFVTSIGDSITILRENFDLQLAKNDSVHYQKSKTFNSSYETPYQYSSVDSITDDGYCCLPILIEKNSGPKILLSESDLENYPGMWLKASEGSSLESAHAGYPLKFRQTGRAYGLGQVAEHADFIAKTEGNREFPWRVFVIEKEDAGLLENTLIYQLAKESRIEDVSWIKPGVVTFDWWGRRNIYGTDFKAGINTETAKYFIDFAAKFGFEYFLFDDGWSKLDDLFVMHPDLNMEEVMYYAKEKKVKIMLWVIWDTFEKQKEAAWNQFESWGIEGIKFDFMNRDDQKMVQFYYEMAAEAAKRKMVIDFHGAYKPAGLRKTFPNVLTREALIEFEYNGANGNVTPDHDNTLPYIRMVTGPMDYIPYTTHNAQKKNWRAVGDRPISQGTRAHSMALYVILESPMKMLPDSPSDYYREKECTEFISEIPNEWDDLKVLEAKLGDYTIVARKNGDDWYIGAITDWTERFFEINFDFLEDGEYELDYIEDGINAAVRAIDYKRHKTKINKNDLININLAPGGGWIAKLKKLKMN